MSDKCNMCKCYVEDGNCPCHFVNDDELCDFNFELINIAEHDKQIRLNTIEEVRNKMNEIEANIPDLCNKNKSFYCWSDLRAWLNEQLKKGE